MTTRNEAEEILWEAVRVLATENGQLNNRLMNAYAFHLIKLDVKDLPTPEMKATFNEIIRSITPATGNQIQERLDAMDVEKRQDIARSICQLYEDLIAS